jgi:hypothetical protein
VISGSLSNPAYPDDILAAPAPRDPEYVTPMGDIDMLEGEMNVLSSVEGEGVKFGRGTDGAFESGDRHRRT